MQHRIRDRKRIKPQYSLWIMRTAAVLSCLTLVSIYLLSGVYARFSSEAYGSDSARVAAFRVTTAFDTASSQISLDNMFPGETRSYQFTVKNDSEVVIQNQILFSATSNLPLKFKLNGSEISKGQTVTTPALTQGATGTYTLTISWDAKEIDSKYVGEIEALWITVTSEQVD